MGRLGLRGLGFGMGRFRLGRRLGLELGSRIRLGHRMGLGLARVGLGHRLALFFLVSVLVQPLLELGE